MGHYKVGALYPKIGQVLTIMMSLPFQYGFSPERWRESIHVMLEKIRGNPRIDKLRIIQLFEADLNAVLKIKIGRNLMHKPEMERILGDDMHGGRKGRTAHDALLTQTVATDISRQKRIP